MMETTHHLALCLDPVHVGTGGYRLGRVDMSIVREPGTGIPKIPGTSLAGAIRAYARLARDEDNGLADPDVVFGTAEQQGMLRFYDAEIVLFPVPSSHGTVWVTTAELAQRWLAADLSGDNGASGQAPTDADETVVLVKGFTGIDAIDLGWLLLKARTWAAANGELHLPPSLGFVRQVVRTSGRLFHHLVNDHLEVRTSVRIDDETGAAKPGYLFTYEAIPRGAVLGFEVAADARRGGDVSVDDARVLLRRALATLKVLGIGGMGTRGFGRVEVLEPMAEPLAVAGATEGVR